MGGVIDGAAWLAEMRAREVTLARRFFGWTNRYGPSRPLPGPPPAGFEGFVDGRRRTAVMFFPFPVPVSVTEWSSADGTVLGTRTGGLTFFTTHLRSGTAVVTWPDTDPGRALAREAADRISVVGGPDPFAAHLGAVARVADTDPPVAFRTVAEREEAGVLYDLHNTSDASVRGRIWAYVWTAAAVLAALIGGLGAG